MPHFFIQSSKNWALMRIDLVLCVVTNSVPQDPQTLSYTAANIVFLSLMKEAFQERINVLKQSLKHKQCIVPHIMNMNIFEFYQNVFHRLYQCDYIPSSLILRFFSDVFISIASKHEHTSRQQLFDKARWCHMHYDLDLKQFHRAPYIYYRNPILQKMTKVWPCGSHYFIALHFNDIVGYRWRSIEENNPRRDVSPMRRALKLMLCPCQKCFCQGQNKQCKISSLSVRGRDFGVFYCRLIFSSALPLPPKKLRQRYSRPIFGKSTKV